MERQERGEEGIHDEVETTIKVTKQLDENRIDLETN